MMPSTGPCQQPGTPLKMGTLPRMAADLRHALLNRLHPLRQLCCLARVCACPVRVLPGGRQLRGARGISGAAWPPLCLQDEGAGPAPSPSPGLQEPPLVLRELRGGILEPQVLQEASQEEVEGTGVDAAAVGRAEGDVRQLRQRDRDAHCCLWLPGLPTRG